MQTFLAAAGLIASLVVASAAYIGYENYLDTQVAHRVCGRQALLGIHEDCYARVYRELNNLRVTYGEGLSSSRTIVGAF